MQGLTRVTPHMLVLIAQLLIAYARLPLIGKLAYIPIIQYTYTKKMFLTKTSCLKLISYHSMDVSGTYHNPFQGSQGPQEGSEAEILTF